MVYWLATMDIDIFARRSRFIRELRNFFYAGNYTEVETPLLCPSLIPEATLEVFATVFIAPDKPVLPLYLIPSPELWMKRIIARERRSIFQICKCFRNGESLSNIHNHEFSMLEWYTVNTGYLDSIQHTEDLFSHLCSSLSLGFTLDYHGKKIDLHPPFLKISMDKMYKDLLGLGIGELDEMPSLRETCKSRAVPVSADDTWEQLFNKLFLTLIEPELPQAKPVFLYDYPWRIPTLAKRKKGTPFAERWELYVGGMEIANCFSEETDPSLLRAFFKTEAEKKRMSRIHHAVDWELLEQIAQLPACSGVALGIDRLFMILYNITHIKEVVFFTIHDIMK